MRNADLGIFSPLRDVIKAAASPRGGHHINPYTTLTTILSKCSPPPLTCLRARAGPAGPAGPDPPPPQPSRLHLARDCAKFLIVPRRPSRRAEDFARPAEERGFKRALNIDLDDPRFDPVFRYALETQPDRPVQDAIRDLLLQATAADQANPAIREARMQAFRETKTRILSEIAPFLHRFAHELELETTGAEPVGAQPGNFVDEKAA